MNASTSPSVRPMAFLRRYIDLSTAWKGALALGLVVWFINLSHGALAAVPAALKQAAYTFVVAGFIARLCERMAVVISNRFTAIALAMLVPSVIAVGLTFLLHSLRGTPEPFYSTVPTLVSAPPFFLYWGIRSRNTPAE